jgi:hypothetical protein
VPVLESGESSIHSWSGVYFFARAVGGEEAEVSGGWCKRWKGVGAYQMR